MTTTVPAANLPHLKHLAFSQTRVAYQQHVDVTTDRNRPATTHVSRNTSQKCQQQRQFHKVVAVDGGAQGTHQEGSLPAIIHLPWGGGVELTRAHCSVHVASAPYWLPTDREIYETTIAYKALLQHSGSSAPNELQPGTAALHLNLHHNLTLYYPPQHATATPACAH